MIYWAHNQPIAGLPGLRISLSKSNDMFLAAKCSLMLINEEKNSLDYSEKKTLKNHKVTTKLHYNQFLQLNHGIKLHVMFLGCFRSKILAINKFWFSKNLLQHGLKLLQIPL